MEAERAEIRIPVPTDALEAVCRRFGVCELSVFGSVLRDDFTPQSDVDVLVGFAPDSLVHGLGFFDLMHALEDEVFHRKVDLIEVGTLSPYIAGEVMAERRIIYVAPSR